MPKTDDSIGMRQRMFVLTTERTCLSSRPKIPLVFLPRLLYTKGKNFSKSEDDVKKILTVYTGGTIGTVEELSLQERQSGRCP